MKEKEFKKYLEENYPKNEFEKPVFNINIYWTIQNGKVFLDEESILANLEDELRELNGEL